MEFIVICFLEMVFKKSHPLIFLALSRLSIVFAFGNVERIKTKNTSYFLDFCHMAFR